MGQMINVNIRMDEDLKKQADYLFNELGLNMSTAVNMFVRQAIRTGGIPFEVTVGKDDWRAAYNAFNADFAAGQGPGQDQSQSQGQGQSQGQSQSQGQAAGVRKTCDTAEP